MSNHEGDRQVLSALASHGANLSLPAHVTHFLYFKSIENANAAASELRSSGYHEVNVGRTPPSSIWQRVFGSPTYSCIAETRVIPSESVVFETTDRMNSLASKFSGEYDGWEASVEK